MRKYAKPPSDAPSYARSTRTISANVIPVVKEKSSQLAAAPSVAADPEVVIKRCEKRNYWLAQRESELADAMTYSLDSGRELLGEALQQRVAVLQTEVVRLADLADARQRVRRQPFNKVPDQDLVMLSQICCIAKS